MAVGSRSILDMIGERTIRDECELEKEVMDDGEEKKARREEHLRFLSWTHGYGTP